MWGCSGEGRAAVGVSEVESQWGRRTAPCTHLRQNVQYQAGSVKPAFTQHKWSLDAENYCAKPLAKQQNCLFPQQPATTITSLVYCKPSTGFPSYEELSPSSSPRATPGPAWTSSIPATIVFCVPTAGPQHFLPLLLHWLLLLTQSLVPRCPSQGAPAPSHRPSRQPVPTSS